MAFEKLESSLLAFQSKKAQKRDVPFRALGMLHDLHALHLLDAKHEVRKSLMFWSDKERCRIAKPEDIDAECKCLETITGFLEKLYEFAVSNDLAQQEELSAINRAHFNAGRCRYRLLLMLKHSSIGEKSKVLSKEYLDPDALELAIISANDAIQQHIKGFSSLHSSSSLLSLHSSHSPNSSSDSLHSSPSNSNTDSCDEQPENYRQIK